MARFWVVPLIILLCSCEELPQPEPFLRAAALEYATYGPVDQDLRAAVRDCEPLPPPLPRLSDSDDPQTHGRKLYFLFARNRRAYFQAKQQVQPDGQVLVKESWIPGKERTKGPLFIMMKSQGDWIYATATPDGKSLTGSGKIASCMKCHEDAPYDKLFGLPEPSMSIDNCKLPEKP